MRAANPLRGEVALPEACGARLLRPTFGALVAAEGELGSLLGVLERAGAGEVRLADMAALFWHCLAEREGLERADFEERLVACGIAVLLPCFRALLGGVFGTRA